MFQPLLLAILSCAGSEGGSPPGTPTALHLESVDTGLSADTFAYVDGPTVRVAPAALADIGLTAFARDPRDWIALHEAPGVTLALDGQASVVRIRCTAACFSRQALGSPSPAPPLMPTQPGVFLNTDVLLSHVADAATAAGAFELGVFGPYGFGEAGWTLATGDRAQTVRLDTRWTVDNPHGHTRLRMGDSIARAGAAADPFRFAGLQVARDFALEPGLVTTPTPVLDGVAAMPSVVDLYIDGALRRRERVAAGPFAIIDAPVITGAGSARIVVTDVLGRQQVIAQPFYGGRAMLRPGLEDFSVSAGVLRENFGVASNDYADAILAGVYRRGLTQRLTFDARAETTDAQSGAAIGASWTPGLAGQFDVSMAQSVGDNAGAIGRFGWSRLSRTFSVSADVEAAADGVVRIGAVGPLPRTRSAVSAGASSGRGAASVSFTHTDWRTDADITTAAIDVMPTFARAGALGFSVLYVNDGAESYAAAVTLSAPFGATLTASTSLSVDQGRVALQARAQQTPEPDGGAGWRLGVRMGDAPRAEAAIGLRGRYGEAHLDVSRALGATGVRAQLATGLVWIDGGLHVSAPVRESFALVDAGAPKVSVLVENRRVGATNTHGVLLLPGLRPYERNRIGLDVDDLPVGAPLARDAIDVTPAARSGVVVRFPVDAGAAGEVRIIDEAGAPLPAGAVLTAGEKRYPVGRGGRLYVSGVIDAQAVRHQDVCIAIVDRAAVDDGAVVVCRRPA